MRIATWNLQRPANATSARALRILDYVEQINADIWVFTETHLGIGPGEGFYMRASNGSDRPQAEGERWVTIWSRFPIVADLPVSDPIRSVCVRLDTPDVPLIVYGTVLPWLSDRRFAPLGGAAAFEAELGKRRSDWTSLQKTHGDCALCIAGDMNQDLSTSHYYGSRIGRNLLSTTLADLRLVCLTCGPNDGIAKATAGERASIDHICLSESWAGRLVSTAAWPQPNQAPNPSDHFGVCVDLRMT